MRRAHTRPLESACGKTKVEVAQIVARLAPQPDAPFSIRKVSAPLNGLPVAAPQATSPEPPASVHLQAAPTGALVPHLLPAPGVPVTPLSPDRYKLQVTIDGETLEMFHLAKDMLGHASPEGDPAAILNRAFKALLTDLARKKFSETSRPRAARTGKAGGRTPSAAVKRTVWVRDLGRCAFVGGSGHRCNERRLVEFHHVDPYALGGEGTVDGIQLRCRRHNDYEGRLYFGTRRRRRQLVPEQAGPSGPGSSQGA